MHEMCAANSILLISVKILPIVLYYFQNLFANTAKSSKLSFIQRLKGDGGGKNESQAFELQASST